MRKSIIILLLILSTLSIAYAIYEGQKAENCKLIAAKKEVALNERIRQLEGSLSRAYKELEAEKRKALGSQK